MLKTYYQLTKPGIIYGNAMTATAGFLLASRGQVNVWLFLATLTGISLIIASACVFNNYIDRDIDPVMARTRHRALATGAVSSQSALLYGSSLGLAGSLILALYSNILALSVALAGFLIYVVAYGVLKRRWVRGTEIGSLAGAIPPVAGYAAAAGHLDTGAFILFIILVIWQMPHFYAIAIYRLKDYSAAHIPVLPIKQGTGTTKIYILVYVLAFTITAPLLTIFGYTGYTYLAIALLLGLTWSWLSLKGLKTTNDTLWAKKLFRFSLIVIVVLSITIWAGPLLP